MENNEENVTIESEETGTENEIKWTPVPEEKPAKKKKKGAGRIIALVLVVAILGGLGGFGVARLTDKVSDAVGSIISKDKTGPEKTPDSKTFVLEPEEPADEKEKPSSEPAEEPAPKEDPAPSAEPAHALKPASAELSAADVYENCAPSTVGIKGNVSVNYWGYKATSPVSGSGFIVSEDGFVVTNYHVIEDVRDIVVTTYSGEEYSAAVAGYDESSDFAILKIEAEGLAPVVIGDSGALRVGDSVLAIGNPLGELTFSLTGGIVSALGREVAISNTYTMALIQTDCAINSGNSGGALFNMKGEVVGITNAKYSSSGSGASIDNIGFAIPINDVEPLIKSVVEKGGITKPYIGISVSTLTDGYTAFGASVVSVVEDSPAAEAGIQAGDVITAIDGETVTTRDELVNAVKTKSVGDEVVLRVLREGQTSDITVTVGEQTQTAESIAEAEAAAEAEEETASQEAPEGQNPFSGFPYGGFFGNGSGDDGNYGEDEEGWDMFDFFNFFNW